MPEKMEDKVGSLNQEDSVRKVDTGAYLDVMKELVQKNNKVGITVAGNSMAPFLVDGRDRVFFEKPDRPLKKGDIVLFQRKNGRYIMHRICRVQDGAYYIVGDAQTHIEGPVMKDQIFARITQCERKGRLISRGDFWWDFFEKIWIRIIPWRTGILKIYQMWHDSRLFRR